MVKLLGYYDPNDELIVKEEGSCVSHRVRGISTNNALDKTVEIEFKSNKDKDSNYSCLIVKARLKTSSLGLENLILESEDGNKLYSCWIPENLSIPADKKVGWDKARGTLAVGKNQMIDIKGWGEDL